MTEFDGLSSGFTYTSCCCVVIVGNLFDIPLGLNKLGLGFCSQRTIPFIAGFNRIHSCLSN